MNSISNVSDSAVGLKGTQCGSTPLPRTDNIDDLLAFSFQTVGLTTTETNGMTCKYIDCYSDENIVKILHEEDQTSVADAARKHSGTEQTIF